MVCHYISAASLGFYLFPTIKKLKKYRPLYIRKYLDIYPEIFPIISALYRRLYAIIYRHYICKYIRLYIVFMHRLYQ